MVKSGRLMIFDTASLYFRAFFGLPTTLRAPDGSVINAVRGVLDFIARLVSAYSPTHLACAWDEDWRPSWRVDLVPSYKSHRLDTASGTAEKVPEELETQVPLIREVLESLGIPIVGVANYEADDVISSLVHGFSGESYVVTGDRDLFQLVTDEVTVVYLGRGVSRHDLITPSWIQQHVGVAATHYVDYAVLRGDPSDGLPGVKGIGDKTAATLIHRFGDLDGIVAATKDPSSDLSPSQRARIVAAADYLKPARAVVAAVADLDLEPVPRWSEERIDRVRFDQRASDLGLGGAANRVLSALLAQP